MLPEAPGLLLLPVFAAVAFEVLNGAAVPGVFDVAVELEGVEDGLQREGGAHVDTHALEPLAGALLAVNQDEGVPDDEPRLAQRLGGIGNAAASRNEVVHDDRRLAGRVDT